MDKLYDDVLNISTSIENNEPINQKKSFFDYEPASYYFLEKLFTLLPFNEKDHLVDFGCGKGRILFMADYNSCKCVTGYEINEERYNTLIKNIESYQNKFGKTTIFNAFKEDVQHSKICETANKFFFFNPFHLKIYMKVIKNIIASIKENERNIEIYLLRPHDSTIKYFDSIDIFHKEIFIEHIFTSNDMTDVIMPQLVIYSNYSMQHSLDECSIHF
jgi:16S rRNA G966 N2-methylase RsmD